MKLAKVSGTNAMRVSRQAPMRALQLFGLMAGLGLAGPAAAQLLTMPPPAPANPPASAPAPAPAPAPAAEAPAAPPSLFGAPAPAAGFQSAPPPQAPASLFGAPAGGAAPSPAPSPMFSGPGAAPAVARPAELPASCETGMAKFQERRQAQMVELDKIVKRAKDGKVDPAASCPKLRALVSVETEMRNWMTKQQSTCSIPNEIMAQMRDATGKTAQIAERACQAAAEMKRQQTGGGGGPAAPAMKLPAGPL